MRNTYAVDTVLSDVFSQEADMALARLRFFPPKTQIVGEVNYRLRRYLLVLLTRV